MGAAERIPVSLVTGFLGSGKTTLITALLEQPSMAGTAVIVNEIGAVGIDDAIFSQALDRNDVVLLANGCLCCAVGDDLAETIWALTQRRPDQPRRIVIETSGLADPAPALRRLMADPRIRKAIRLDGLIATIDAVNGLKNIDTQPVALRQCAVADRRLITKTDIAGPQAAAELSQRLLSLNPCAPVVCVNHGAIDADRLFGNSLFDAKSGRAELDRWLAADGFRALPHWDEKQKIHFSGETGPVHGVMAGSWLIEESRPVDWQSLSPRLGDIIARYGDHLLRLKGVIQTIGDTRPLVIHGVQRLFHTPVRLNRWLNEPATTIIAIGDEGAKPAIDLVADALDRSVGATQTDPGRNSNDAVTAKMPA